MPVPERHAVNGAPLAAAVSGRPRAGRLRPRLLLGRRAEVLADARVSSRPPSATRAGTRKNPTYEEVCSGRTGHTEVVLVVFDPAQGDLRRPAEGVLGESRPDAGHAPGQRRRHAVPVGDLRHLRRRSARAAERSRARYQARARAGTGFNPITTEIRDAPPFYYAEDYHQQYLAKNPGGYCGIGGTGVKCTAVRHAALCDTIAPCAMARSPLLLHRRRLPRACCTALSARRAAQRRRANRPAAAAPLSRSRRHRPGDRGRLSQPRAHLGRRSAVEQAGAR